MAPPPASRVRPDAALQHWLKRAAGHLFAGIARKALFARMNPKVRFMVRPQPTGPLQIRQRLYRFVPICVDASRPFRKR
jgi:hypothetical protein